MEDPIHLTGLPVEVLDLIFKELHLEEKLHLAQADPLLGIAFAVHSRSDFVDMDIRNPKLSVEKWPVILSLCGRQVRQINGMWDSQNRIPFRLIERECPFLESILFNVNNNNLVQISSLLRNIKSLRSVHLHIREDCEASADIINGLMQLPSLTKLLLHGFACSEVYYIQNLINLENLSLTLRSHSPAINIFEILSVLKNLRALFISNIKILENQNSYFPELEDLEIFSCHTYSMLPQVPKLKSLRFRRNPNFSPDFSLFNWVSMHAYTLEFLELFFTRLPGTEIEFGEQDLLLLQMLQNCTNLRTLHMCNSVTWHFVESLIIILTAKGFRPEGPFQLVSKNFEKERTLFNAVPYFALLSVRGPAPFERRCAWGSVQLK